MKYTTAAFQANTVVDTAGCGDACIVAFCVDWYCGGSITRHKMVAGTDLLFRK